MQASLAIRFGLVVMRSAPSTAATAMTPAKSRVGAPASQSSPKRTAVRMIAVPMSPPSMMSPRSSSPTGTSGTSMCFHWFSSRLDRLRASRSAPHSTSASLANSLGWSWNGPPR
jgi:hypothetical protein